MRPFRSDLSWISYCFEIREFAIEGCRTLAFAYRELTKAEFENFQKLYDEANKVIQNREEMIERAFLKFESDLELLGATAVNDQLQSGVPWSINKLKEAGIVITILTGDKVKALFIKIFK